MIVLFFQSKLNVKHFETFQYLFLATLGFIPYFPVLMLENCKYDYLNFKKKV